MLVVTVFAAARGASAPRGAAVAMRVLRQVYRLSPDLTLEVTTE